MKLNGQVTSNIYEKHTKIEQQIEKKNGWQKKKESCAKGREVVGER